MHVCRMSLGRGSDCQANRIQLVYIVPFEILVIDVAGTQMTLEFVVEIRCCLPFHQTRKSLSVTEQAAGNWQAFFNWSDQF